MDKENACLYKLVIMWVYEEMDNAWILERVGEWVNDWVITWRCESLGQWVSDEMREQSSEETDEWNYESEWENEEVCELMSEDLNQYVSE